jgi:hypothetical protein
MSLNISESDHLHFSVLTDYPLDNKSVKDILLPLTNLLDLHVK